MEKVLFDRLLPNPRAGIPVEEIFGDLREDLTIPADRAALLLNMVSTVDGRTSVQGSSRDLGGAGDLAHLLELRTIADAVLVGTGTVAVEGYGRLIRKEDRRARRIANNLAPDPPLVMISRSFQIEWNAPLFADPDQPIWIYTSGQAVVPDNISGPVEVIFVDDDSPAAVLRHLKTERNIDLLVCEGGPTLNSELVKEGLVDELFLTVAPLIGGEPSELTILSGRALTTPVELALRWVLHNDGELFVRYSFEPRT